MKLRQQAVPFIWGYQKLLREVTLDIKSILTRQQQHILLLLQPVFDNPNGQFKHNKESLQTARERRELVRAQAAAIFALLRGWSFGEREEAIQNFVDAYTESYLVGVRDGRMKMEIALKKYRGKFKNQIAALIRALREDQGNRTLPISLIGDINRRAANRQDAFDQIVSRQLANDIALTTVKTSIDEDEKREEIDKKTTAYFASNQSSATEGKFVTSDIIATSLFIYFTDLAVPFVTWVVDNPQDSPCYSSDTEILSKDGWVNMYSGNLDSREFVTLDKSGQVRTSKVNKVITKKWEGEMYHFKSKNTDLLITPDHNICYITENKQRDGNYEYEFRKASDKLAKRFAMPKSSMHKATGVEYIDFLGIDIPTNLYVKLLGWYLSEGSILNKGCGIRVSQSRDKNLSKWEEIKEITNTIGRYYDFNVTHDKVGSKIFGKKIASYFKQFGKSYEKYIPKEIFDFSSSDLESFLDAYIKGDGTYQKYRTRIGKESRVQITITTSSYSMVGGLSRIALLLGYGVSVSEVEPHEQQFSNGIYKVRKCYKIRLVKGKYANVSNIDIVSYNDHVWCLELEKDHTLFVKRNGKCIWSGNCIQPANEIVRLGEPFSNGFVSPPVHNHGHCSLDVVTLDDTFVERLVKRFL